MIRPYLRQTRAALRAALCGSAMLALPFAALGETPEATPSQESARTAADNPADSGPRSHRRETVEQRISALHKALEITPAEEPQWSDVAQAMRKSAANMEKLALQESAASHKGMTALDDLDAYQKFAQAHVDGLQSLNAAFGTLYKSEPATQQKIADHVFETFGTRHAHARPVQQ
jgi:hypothetical protein